MTILDGHGFFMGLKSDVLMLLRNFFVEVETQFGKKVQRIRSDNEGEFFNHGCKELF